MDLCFECGSELSHQKTNLEKKWNNDYYTIIDVPVMICPKCNEEYFDGPILARVEELLKSDLVDRVKKRVQYQ